MSEKKDRYVYGRIVIDVEIDIDNSTEKEALEKAIEIFKESYNLNVIGYHHNIENDVKLDLNVGEYE